MKYPNLVSIETSAGMATLNAKSIESIDHHDDGTKTITMASGRMYVTKNVAKDAGSIFDALQIIAPTPTV